jgi:uncharacterized membrane protein YbhN (UPF0104 family)
LIPLDSANTATFMLNRFRLLSATAAPKKKSPLKLFIRIGITVILLGMVYGKADRIALLKTFESLSLGTVLVLCLLYTGGQLLSAVRWRMFIAETGMHRSFNTILRAYFFGMLVNIVGIGTVGGDVARAIALRPKKGEGTASLASVIADRVFGLITLVTIGALFSIFVQPAVLGPWVVPGCIATVLALSAMWFLGPKTVVRFLPQGRFRTMGERASQAFPTGSASLLRVTWISIVFHSTQIFMHIYMARMLGADLPAAYLFAVVPLINTAASMPLSVQGIGIRESLYMLFFTPAGVPHEVCLAFGAMWILTVTLVSAVGGFLLPPVAEEGPVEAVEIDAAIEPAREQRAAG